jgi:FtsP/CotA-like multicopper oxidase with cupredoxin domain
MSRNQRIGLLAGAVVVAVVAFVIAQSGGDDEGASRSESSGLPAETDQSEGSSEAAKPEVTRIATKGGVLVGDAKTITVKKDDVVRIVITSDVPDEMHLHGYDIEEEAGPGKPARFEFTADVEGSFELESHAAEDAGKEPLLARLHVEP